MANTESEKARLDALIGSGYRGSSRQLEKEHGFAQTVIQIYYMPILRKYKRQKKW